MFTPKLIESENKARESFIEEVHTAVDKEESKSLNRYSIKDVADYFNVSYNTAWLWFRDGLIPYYEIGSRKYCHGYILESIEKKARDLFSSNYVKRSFPRMVYKYNKGLRW